MTSLPLLTLCKSHLVLDDKGGRWGGRPAVFRDSLNWVWLTHFVCSFSKNWGDASSHQTLLGALR